MLRRLYVTAEPASSTEEMNNHLKSAKEVRLAWMDRSPGQQGVNHLVGRFRDNLKYRSATATTVASTANKDRNRYRDIPCIDSSRVILKGKQPDYINANWVVAASGQKYICTQGPIPSTVPDFWQMVVQEHCCTIVMLCRLVEYGKDKCAPYFP
ncbi:Protein-tyrosine phosphatase [Cooperia oncophora]